MITAKELHERYPETSIPVRDDDNDNLKDWESIQEDNEEEVEGDDNYNDIDNDIEQMEQEVKETGVNTGSFNEIDGNLLSNDPVGDDDDDDDDEGFIALAAADSEDEIHQGGEHVALSVSSNTTTHISGVSGVKTEVAFHMGTSKSKSKEKDKEKHRKDNKGNSSSDKSKGNKGTSKSKSGIGKMLSASNFLSKFTSGHKRKHNT